MKSTISPAPRPPSITSTTPSRPRKPAYTARSTCWAWRSEPKRKFFRHPRAKSMATSDDVTGPVNLGNPEEFTILELARKVIANTGSRSEIVFEPLPSDDPMQRQPDISLARQMLQWEPVVALNEGLRRTISYFR